VLELEQLARAAHERLTQFAEEEVTRRWTELEEVEILLNKIFALNSNVSGYKRSHINSTRH